MSVVLKSLSLDTMTREDAERLWSRIRGITHCFDDLTRDRGDIFARRLTALSTAPFECEHGLVLVENIVPRLSAEMHFYLWDRLPEDEIVEYGRQACREIFDVYKVHRLSAFPPDFNRLARRIAIRLGFKWEGNIRQQFLYEKKYHDVIVYGLLAQEFAAREGR